MSFKLINKRWAFFLGYHTPPIFFLTKPARTVCFKIFIKCSNCSIHFLNYQKTNCVTIFIMQCSGSTTLIFLPTIVLLFPRSNGKNSEVWQRRYLDLFCQEQALSWKFYMWATNHPRKDFRPGNINTFFRNYIYCF